MKRPALGVLVLIVGLLGATAPVRAASTSPDDPWEPFNRKMFMIHAGLDKVLFRPLSTFYTHATPSPVRTGVHNFVRNLSEPIVAMNDLFQGRFRPAAESTTRFIGNSFFGVFGVMDVVGRGQYGLQHHDNDFGMTLGRYGAVPGPYLFIPVMGPSTVRDAFGTTVDAVASPFNYVGSSHKAALTVFQIIGGGLDKRSTVDKELRAALDNAADPYATLRSMFLQNRQSDIEGGVTIENLPEVEMEPGTEPSGEPPATEPAPATEPEPSTEPAPTDQVAPPSAPTPQTLPPEPAPTAPPQPQSEPEPKVPPQATLTRSGAYDARWTVAPF